MGLQGGYGASYPPFEVNGREGFDDGWSHEDDAPTAFATQVTDEYRSDNASLPSRFRLNTKRV